MNEEWKLLAKEDYLDHLYNNTKMNERAIEIPLALRWLERKSKVFEVGAVIPYYSEFTHEVIDPYDEKATINDFMENIDLNGSNVLSISTLEHIGTKDFTPEWEYHSDLTMSVGDVTYNDENAAIEALKQLLNQVDDCLITIPIGYNCHLDDWLKKNLGRLDCFGYELVQQFDKTVWPPVRDKVWEYHESPKHLNYFYNSPYPFANFVLFIEGWKSK